ncbi:MAG TPA: hypothetical protein VHH09_07870, partial [Acidimicrobiales bacterium]|nr:hypothetical protein [Acidimicrobiales bacterium]
TTTAAPDGVPGPTTPPINNTNNNQNNNDNTNTSDNENNNTTDNTNTNDNANTQDQTQTNTQTNDQSQTNSQTQQGGNNTNSNVISITNTGSNFDDFHRRGRFHNDHDGDKVHGDHHFGKALARTGSESSRLTGVALLLLIVGSVLVLGTRTVTAEAAAVPGTRASRRLRRRR